MESKNEIDRRRYPRFTDDFSCMTGDLPTTEPGKVRILIVEDEVLIQMLYLTYLEELGLVAAVAGTAAEALEKLEKIGADFDAAIVDLGLPDSNGDTLVREIRRLYPELPIIISSGYDSTTLRARFGKGCAEHFLAKPFRSDDLKTLLTALGLVGPE